MCSAFRCTPCVGVSVLIRLLVRMMAARLIAMLVVAGAVACGTATAAGAVTGGGTRAPRPVSAEELPQLLAQLGTGKPSTLGDGPMAGLQGILLDNNATSGAGAWTVTNANGTIHVPASVPGQVHTDLMAANVIGDPYYRFNDLEYRWVAMDNWTYSREFNVTQEFISFGELYLVATGLDTVATVSINDVPIGYANNMFRRWIFNATDVLKVGVNTISVGFQSAVTYALNEANAYPVMPVGVPPACPPDVQQGFCHPNFIRKEPCSFSWDWGPAFAPQGIWKSIFLVSTTVAITDVTAVSVLLNGGGADGVVADDGTDTWAFQVNVYLNMLDAGIVSLTVDIVELQSSATQTYYLDAGKSMVTFTVVADGGHAWWPAGYGAQPLYTLNVTANTPDGVLLAQRKVRSGLRTVELVQEPLPGGKSFYFKINDVPVFIKGANWVPADSFESRVSYDVLRNLLQSCADANMNAIRNWGGGIYQQDEFYDIADELGLLVWEEFMFACALYPTDAEFLDNVAAEVTDQLIRLMSHPSVFVWSGNNENEAAIADDWYGTMDFTPVYADAYSRLYFDTVIHTVNGVDTSRPVLSSSPSDGNETASSPVSPNPGSTLMGDTHYYNYQADCWDVSNFPTPRFASEYGYQTYPSFISMEGVSDESQGDWTFNSSFMLHRQHHPDGNAQILTQMQYHFNIPTSSDPETEYRNMLFMTQVSGALCIKSETEHYRRYRNQGSAADGGYTMGTMYWQANDIWQGASWSSLEYLGRWKVLHYYAKQFYEQILVSPYLQDGNVVIFFINDWDGDLSGDILIKVWSWAKGLVATESTPYTASQSQANHVWTVPLAQINTWGNCQPAECFITVHATNSSNDIITSNYHFLYSIKNVTTWQNPKLTITSVTQAATNVFNVEVSASAMAAVVWLETPLPGRFSDNGFIMTTDTVTLQFTAWDDTTAAFLQQSMTITSLYDVYNS